MRKFVYLLIFVLAVAAYLTSIEDDYVKERRDEQRELDRREDNLIFMGKQAVKGMLKDPESATFRNVFVSRAALGAKEVSVSCGEVNAKNGFGGYSGY